MEFGVVNMELPGNESQDGRRRVVVENLQPSLDAGRFPIKRTLGDRILTTVDVFGDGHDLVRANLLVRKRGQLSWRRTPLEPLGNDRWQAAFECSELGTLEYTVEAWVDHFQSWLRDLRKRIDAQQNIAVDLIIGSEMLAHAVERATGENVRRIVEWQGVLADQNVAVARLNAGGFDDLGALMDHYPDRRFATIYEPHHQVIVDRERARFSTWYEMFPRSTASEPGRHGTLRDCIARLPYVASMGFDVLYLPPVHPIGLAFRKGKNNSVTANPDEPGSPWAIGGEAGGHKSILPELGTLDDFRELVTRAREQGIDIALDIAYQCSPDHPYVKEHPEWFKSRPDGTIQYAENPPKKYQDIYPFDFETDDWQALWEELKSVIVFWCEQGVRVFRVDNPHTKAFPFWEWMIAEVKFTFPDVIFLAEAFTRPRVMERLAKLGFSQSYTYFTWRNTKPEFVEYLTELTKTTLQEYFRPNFWPNTPDILPEHLQVGGRGAFMARLVLAGTLTANYGIYGPAFELGEHVPVKHGSEEYLDSEKYEIREWDLQRSDSLREFITRVNRARRENPALQSNQGLTFHAISNDQMLCYSKQSTDRRSLTLMVVNLDFRSTQGGWLELPLDRLGLPVDRPYRLTDLLSDATYTWQGVRNYVQLDPFQCPAHLFKIEV